MQAAQTGSFLGRVVKHVVPAVLRPLRSLWNEVIGFIFLALSVHFGIFAVRYAMNGEHGKLALTGLFTLMMAGFGISSFRRARKISRS